MAEEIGLTLSCGDYDRTRPLWDGSVQPEGISLNCVVLEPNEIFRRMLKDAEFDVSEMSLSNYIMECGGTSRRFAAIPVFLSRAFRHSNIYVNRASGIREAKDLRGKKVGLSEYHTSAALWVRGLLAEEYRVAPSEIEWVTGGVEAPGLIDRMRDFVPPPGVRIRKAPPGSCLNGMLKDGEIDALVNPRKPSCFDGRKVGRLWPDYRGIEEDYYQRTKIFPIMHVVVIKKEICVRYPWAARSLYRAFTRAKEAAMAKLTQTGTLPVSLPWAFSEAEKARELMGEDFWPYGVEPNRHVLETMLGYAREQGLCPPRITIDDLFPASADWE